jgi:hypothetical protein
MAGRTYIGKRPTNPQDALDESLRLGPNTQRRVGYDRTTKEISVFDRDRDWWDVWDDGDQMLRGGIYHGHVRPWEMLDSQMKRVLIDAKLFNHRGKFIGE